MRSSLVCSCLLVPALVLWSASATPAPEAHGDGCIALVINDPDEPEAFFTCLNFPDECAECFEFGGDEGKSCGCSPIGPYPDCCRLTFFPNNPPATNTQASGDCDAAGCYDVGVCVESGRLLHDGSTSHFALCRKASQHGGGF